jgi:hypothetical protein
MASLPNCEPQQGPRALRHLMQVESEAALEAFDDIIVAVEVDDYDDALRRWQQFQSQLLRRMNVEAHVLLPVLAHGHAQGARVLHLQQRQLRKALSRLKTALQLRGLRAEHTRAFRSSLHAFTRNQDEAYAWTDEHLPTEQLSHLVQVMNQAFATPPTQQPPSDFATPQGLSL